MDGKGGQFDDGGSRFRLKGWMWQQVDERSKDKSWDRCCGKGKCKAPDPEEGAWYQRSSSQFQGCQWQSGWSGVVRVGRPVLVQVQVLGMVGT